MKAKSNELTVESMTQRYSLGHKALSVALSVVLMGFGWPAVSPSQVYAGDGAAATMRRRRWKAPRPVQPRATGQQGR